MLMDARGFRPSILLVPTSLFPDNGKHADQTAGIVLSRNA